MEGKCEDGESMVCQDNLNSKGPFINIASPQFSLAHVFASDNTIENALPDEFNGILGKTVQLYNVLEKDGNKTVKKIKFVEPCPKVEWAGEIKLDNSFVVNSESDEDEFLVVTVFNPNHGEKKFFDMTSDRLKSVKLKYRRLGDLHWSVALTKDSKDVDFSKEYANEDDYGFSWIKWRLPGTGGSKDAAAYEIKVETKCDQLGGPADFDGFSSPIISGVIDLQPPEVYGKPLPLRDFVLIGEEITVIFSESLQCESPLSFDIQLDVDGVDKDTFALPWDKHMLQVVCEERKIGIQIDLTQLPNSDISPFFGKTFTLEIGKIDTDPLARSVSHVYDKNGNAMENNVIVEKVFANVQLDEAAASFTLTLNDHTACENRTLSTGLSETAIMDEILGALSLSSTFDRDRIQLTDLRCVVVDLVANVKISPSFGSRRLRTMSSLIMTERNDDFKSATDLIYKLRDESMARMNGTPDRKRKLYEGSHVEEVAVATDKNQFSISSFKILPSESDRKAITTSAEMRDEEDGLYRIASGATSVQKNEMLELERNAEAREKKLELREEELMREIRTLHDSEVRFEYAALCLIW